MARRFTMRGLPDLNHWTANMRSIVLVLILCTLLPVFIYCSGCADPLSAHFISTDNDHVNKVDEGWGYYCTDCNRYFSLRYDSFFSRAKKSLKSYIVAIFHFARDSKDLADIISKDTHDPQDATTTGWKSARNVYPVIELFSQCCAKLFNDEFPMLGANNEPVEIDESAHSKKAKYNVGTISPTRWVFGITQTGTKWKKFFHVPNRSRATLIPIILEYIVPRAIIVSDCWLAYACLDDLGFQHIEVNHSYGFSDPMTGYNTNTIESCWKHTKQFTITKGGCTDEMLQLKLDLHSFRQMYLSDNKDNAFVIVAKAIATNWRYFR
eukprot:444536_1